MSLPRAAVLASALATTGTVLGSLARHRWTQRIAKPLIVPTLQAGAVVAGNRSPILLAASTGAAVGDWFMLRRHETADPIEQRRHLRRGAAGFAVQQVGYSVLFGRGGSRLRARTFGPVLGTLLAVSTKDTASTGRPDPVLFGYGLSLAAMVALAIDSGGPARLGGLLFLASDSAIILGADLPAGSLAAEACDTFVMTTYAAAQNLLIGALR